MLLLTLISRSRLRSALKQEFLVTDSNSRAYISNPTKKYRALVMEPRLSRLSLAKKANEISHSLYDVLWARLDWFWTKSQTEKVKRFEIVLHTRWTRYSVLVSRCHIYTASSRRARHIERGEQQLKITQTEVFLIASRFVSFVDSVELNRKLCKLWWIGLRD